jgi:DNA primase
MTSTWVNFKHLREHVSIESVIGRYRMNLRRVGPTELRGRCPLPMHTSQKSRDSFSVSTQRGLWSCRSGSCMAARRGRQGGDVLDLVSLLENCSIHDAAVQLHGFFARSAHGARRPAAQSSPRLPMNQPLGFTLKYIDFTHSYLIARGVRLATARAFGIGLYQGDGMFRGRLVIPIHSEEGALIAYAGRAIGCEEPKYRFPAGFAKSAALFNFHRAVATKQRTAIVVEGFFDALAVHQAGFRSVVALMGSSLSARMADQLCKCFERVVLMLDGDLAGHDGTKAITAALSTRVRVNAIDLPDGVQPDQLMPPALYALIANSVRR